MNCEESLIECTICKGLKVFPVQFYDKKWRGIYYFQTCFYCKMTGKIKWTDPIVRNKWYGNDDILEQGSIERRKGKWWNVWCYPAFEKKKHHSCYTLKGIKNALQKMRKNMSFEEISKLY